MTPAAAATSGIPPAFERVPLDALPTPCLLVDLAAADRNIARATAIATAAGTSLRPHFKAHKCTSLMRRQLAAGSCTGVTCATAAELAVLAAGGFADVLLANQVVDRSGLAAIVAAARDTAVTVCADDPRHVALLDAAAVAGGVRLGVLVELDVGAGRCGLAPASPDLPALARAIAGSEALDLRGLMGFEGHAVLDVDARRRSAAVDEATGILRAERRRLAEAGLSCATISGGGTGTLEQAAAAGLLTEVQAGSYVLMDARYATLGLAFEPAVFCRATVISRRAGAAVADAGLKALSVELGPPAPVRAGVEVVRLSDEHVQLRLGPDDGLAIGDPLFLVPGHLDPAVNLHPSLFAVDEDGEVVEWAVDGRR